MNTPPTGVHDPSHVADLVADVLTENLSRRLEKVVKSREEATPEPKSQEDAEQCYQWICEELRNHFKPDQAEKHRRRISRREYWELESRHYSDALKELMWQKACAAHGVALEPKTHCEPTADCWRALALFYQGLLRDNGLSSQQIREVRHSIDNQRYWQPEAEVFQQRVALHEHKMQKALRKKDEAQRRRQIRSRQPAQPARPVRRPQPTNKTQLGGGVASRTRSQTKSIGAGVVKRGLRGPRVGAKAARRG